MLLNSPFTLGKALTLHRCLPRLALALKVGWSSGGGHWPSSPNKQGSQFAAINSESEGQGTTPQGMAACRE